MIIRNVKVYMENQKFEEGEVVVQDGKIADILKSEDACKKENTASLDEVLDGEGCYVIPGLIDLHFHGCKGYDFCDGTKKAITKIAKYEASVGVTAIAPATMTLPVEELEEILRTAAAYKREAEEKKPAEGLGKYGWVNGVKEADLVGINMEGPFISEEKKGAQDARNIIQCNADICQRFLDVSEGLVKFVGIAPERSKDADAFIQKMKGKVNISLAHTNADYDTAMNAYSAGANHAVHLYNAMPAFTHRAPGVVGAVADNAHVNAEMICDGIHIHPAVVRATFKMLGADRIVLISDSMRATGMPDGQYILGGLEVNVSGGRATLVSNGALAGSATNLMECLKTAVKKMGIPLETAVACATRNPAKCLGIYGEYGSIAPGKKADLVLLDQELNVKAVIKDGGLLNTEEEE